MERKKGETNNTENRGERVRGLCRFLNLSAVGVASCLSCSSVKVCVVKQQENKKKKEKKTAMRKRTSQKVDVNKQKKKVNVMGANDQ